MSVKRGEIRRHQNEDEVKGQMEAQKKGYLNSEFRIFYLTNAEPRDFQSHYHDFHKLLFFESGSVSYYIEGETYQLQPYDLVLVPAGEVHRPVIHDDSPYRRLIVYLSPAFFDGYRTGGSDLFSCFSACIRRNSHVLRAKKGRESRLYPQIRELISTVPAQDSGSLLELYQRSLLVQILILLSFAAEGDNISYPAASVANPQVLRALSYINEHLREELSVNRIADACFLNRSYLMHLFRRETGYTIGTYITEKRLFAARTMIRSGCSVTEACMQSGFPGYSSFYRAYRKKFGEPPKESRLS